MSNCSFCGAPLTGAKRFCVKCGREQKGKAVKEAAGKKGPSKREERETLACHKCGEETERTCYFCHKPICFHHTQKMQANALPEIEFRTAQKMGNHRKINWGWRGFIISVCSRCKSMYNGRALTDEDLRDIQTLDKCSWFELTEKPLGRY